MKHYAELVRVRKDKNTLGQMDIYTEDGEQLDTIYTLELPDKNNERRVSCIPCGTYPVQKYSSQKFPHVFELKNVPKRDKILIHAGNFTADTLGCILVGMDQKDINQDGEIDNIQSVKAMNILRKYNLVQITISEI